MHARCVRYGAAGIVLLAGAVLADAQATPSPAAYRDAVSVYVTTGDPARAVQPLLGWDRKTLDAAVADVIASQDATLIEAAAVLHLEIGVAIAGISTASSHGYFELGAQLIDNIVPVNPDVRGNLSAERAADIARARATYLGVVGSAFLSVNDVFRARPFFARALRIAPNSPAILTLQGTADEIDGVVMNPDDVESLAMKRRVGQQRTRLLLSAEQLYRRALSADPTYALAHIRLGRVEFLFKNMKAAAVSLEKGGAAAKDPSHRYLAAMFLGAYLQEQKDYDGARAQFERAIKLNHRSQNAIVALAYVEMISGRPDKAQALARSFTGMPNSDEGWWAYKNGTLDSAGLQWLRARVRK